MYESGQSGDLGHAVRRLEETLRKHAGALRAGHDTEPDPAREAFRQSIHLLESEVRRLRALVDES